MVEFIVFHINGDISHHFFKNKGVQDAARKLLLNTDCSWAEVQHEDR